MTVNPNGELPICVNLEMMMTLLTFCELSLCILPHTRQWGLHNFEIQ